MPVVEHMCAWIYMVVTACTCLRDCGWLHMWAFVRIRVPVFRYVSTNLSVLSCVSPFVLSLPCRRYFKLILVKFYFVFTVLQNMFYHTVNNGVNCCFFSE